MVGHGVHELPPGPEPGAGARARRAGLAPRAERDGVGRQEPAPDLRADEGSEAQRRQDAAQIVEHNAHDDARRLGLDPGAGREPAPGTQEQFGAIIAAWVETGAECPSRR